MPTPKELASDGINYHLYRYEKGNPALNPETSYQFDAGFDWKANNLLVNVAAFVNYFPNYIYLNPTYEYEEGMQVYQYTEAEVFRYGGELTFDYYILPELKTMVAAEYVYSVQTSGEKEGFTIPFSPPPSVLLELRYAPIIRGIWDNTYFMLDYRIVAAQNDIVPPEQKTEGYQVLNFGMGTYLRLGKQRISINLQVQNVLNRKYFNHTSFYRLINIPEPGRNVLLSLKIPFETKR
jgi:iron complex outermembrane receptor protein